MLTFAITFITMALVFYSVGVWSEKVQKVLKPWHVVVFFLGLACDTLGTGAMGRIAGDIFRFNFHGITGLIAIILMAFHAIWATVVIIKKDDRMLKSFHKLSIFVWFVWLVPFLSGMIFGMASGL